MKPIDWAKVNTAIATLIEIRKNDDYRPIKNKINKTSVTVEMMKRYIQDLHQERLEMQHQIEWHKRLVDKLTTAYEDD